jgi:aspartate aminotransferase
MAIDLHGRLGQNDVLEPALSDLARGTVGSEILKIAAEIRGMKARGAAVCNLTVGDFDPAYFPIPASLLEGVRAALSEGHTNYPPSDGVPALREAVSRFYERELGLRYPVESVLIAGGARPLLYAAYKAILDPGEVAVYPVPSWNNNHYCYLVGAKGVEVPVTAASNFFPTPEQIKPHLDVARLVLINSPLNPTGTAIAPEMLASIAGMIVEENERRRKTGQKGLFLVYDQVYWQLTFGATKHVTPIELVPEVAPWTVLLDAASKAFAATGLRVGWGLMAPVLRQKMGDILGHVGAWAPKAEQVAVAKLLDDAEGIRKYHATMKPEVEKRLALLSQGLLAMKRDGYPVDVLEPQGAIYLSARLAIPGKTNEEVRRLVLERASVALVPFQAFGFKDDTGWFRISVGAVSMEEIQQGIARLREAIPRSG